jgi:hypothetical protein
MLVMKLAQSPLLLALAGGAALLGCKPSVGLPPYLVTSDTLLAVRGEPAEARPGESVTYSFLLASPSVGTVGDADALWDVCLTPKPPAESNAVSSACTGVPDAGVTTSGQTFDAPVPIKACQLFGPIAPPPANGQPAVRPRDPDSTGGYYLPVQVLFPSLATGALSGFAMERITCGLASAPASAIGDYNSKYQPNQDPAIDHTDLLLDAVGNSLRLDDGPRSVTAGSIVSVVASFVPGSAETFPVYDPQSEALVDQQESLHMSWFVTGGTFEHDRTGVAAGEDAISTSNQWTAPTQPGAYFLWLVLRDSRGGTDYKSYQIQVGL